MQRESIRQEKNQNGQRVAAYFHWEGERVRCVLCPHDCLIPPGGAGRCRVRQHKPGQGLVATTYGHYTALALDPVEKKPLFHFYPGKTVLSLGTAGCNLRCQFCQNWQISQTDLASHHITVAEIVRLAKRYSQGDCVGVAFTYNEPLMWYEFVLEAARAVQKAGLKTVLVTNGYLQPEPWQELLAYVDALNVDVKAFTDEFYRRVCGGSLAPVLENVQIARRHCHLELTQLIIPGYNDDLESIREFARWVGANLGRDTPVHFSRYYPNYRMDAPPTPVEILEKAREIASAWLDYVYLGNIGDTAASHTYCPRCGAVVVERSYYRVSRIYVREGACQVCGQDLPLVL